jgi:hypothetical protein
MLHNSKCNKLMVNTSNSRITISSYQDNNQELRLGMVDKHIQWLNLKQLRAQLNNRKINKKLLEAENLHAFQALLVKETDNSLSLRFI